jgi:hypothetical protein
MNDDGEPILYYGIKKPEDRNFADVVAIDDEIIGWLARHERHVDCAKRHGFSENRSQERARGLAVGPCGVSP